MDALVFSWSGSFRDRFESRAEEIAHSIAFAHEHGFEVGVVSSKSIAEAEADVESQDVDFVLGPVEDLREALSSLSGRFGKVFFVSDVRAELATANQSGAFTIGYNSADLTADDLGGIGPNYIVDDLGELEQILLLEGMDG